jgi:hypothetical protein
MPPSAVILSKATEGNVAEGPAFLLAPARKPGGPILSRRCCAIGWEKHEPTPIDVIRAKDLFFPNILATPPSAVILSEVTEGNVVEGPAFRWHQHENRVGVEDQEVVPISERLMGGL